MFVVGLLTVALAAAAARADVFEIDDRGAVHSRERAGEVQWVATSHDDADPDTSGDTALPDAVLPDAALTSLTAPNVPDAWRASLDFAAARYGISSDLLAALVWQESRWQPGAVSPKGAIGLAQLMPATARAMADRRARPGRQSRWRRAISAPDARSVRRRRRARARRLQCRPRPRPARGRRARDRRDTRLCLDISSIEPGRSRYNWTPK